MSELKDLKIALVHDELTRRGGAEIVLEEMIRLLPHADVYALYAGRPQITVVGIRKPVHTTFLQRLPGWFRRHPSRVLPFLSYAAEQIDLAEYDLVVSSSSGFAKGIVTRANVPHVSYCHTPTRYLWEPLLTVKRSRLAHSLGSLVIHHLRLADYTAAQRVDTFLANSHWTAERIRSYYSRESTVVHPPADTAFFTPPPRAQPRQGFFLCVGRLTPSKQFEQAIEICEKLKLPLVVVGKGHHAKYLKSMSSGATRFEGTVSRERLRELYRSARALLQPGEEDFGIASVEAQAAGCPVIALGRGGATETIRHGETGILYQLAGDEGLAEGIRQFIANEEAFDQENLQRWALRFNTNAFRHSFTQALTTAVNTSQGAAESP